MLFDMANLLGRELTVEVVFQPGKGLLAIEV
jgi:hypothetical protein